MIYVVLGIGRCGTSALSALLHNNGIVMGEKMLNGPCDENPKGYWEDMEVRKINHYILSYYNFAEYKIKINEIKLNDCNDIQGFINKRNKQYREWGFKDPRITLTLPIWKKYLPKNTKYIYITRNKRSNVISLLKQNNKISTVEYGELVYDTYNEQIKNYRLNNFLAITYEELLKGKCEALNNFVNKNLDYSFVDKNLRRN